jgi:N-sulfoglucosamine sulfohydrolase
MARDLLLSLAWQAAVKEKQKYVGRRPVEAFLKRPEFELYDLEADSDEVHNLAYDPKYQQILSEYRGKLKVFQQETNDPWMES